MNNERLRALKEIVGETIFSMDVDLVVAGTAYPVIEKFNKDFGTDYPVGAVDNWFAVKKLAVKHGMNEQDASAYDNWIWTDAEILSRAPVMPGAAAFIQRLTRNGIEHFFITSRLPSLKETTLGWFRENLPGVDLARVCTNQDSEVRGKDFKWQTVARLGIGVHIDDDALHSRLVLENTPASVWLLSNSKEADALGSPRLVRFKHPQRLPNLKDVHKYLLFSVAQSY